MTTQPSIFSQLGLEQEYKENKSLFKTTETKINGDNCIKRIQFVLKTYSRWIKSKISFQPL